MPTLEATAEVTGTEIMHFGDWFMGGFGNFRNACGSGRVSIYQFDCAALGG